MKFKFCNLGTATQCAFVSGLGKFRKRWRVAERLQHAWNNMRVYAVTALRISRVSNSKFIITVHGLAAGGAQPLANNASAFISD
jgi:hypothetical protein